MNTTAQLQTLLPQYLLRLADNCLVLSQQLCRWSGHGPTLEDDLALSNVALDLLGQARLWLEHVGKVDPARPSEDALAYLRQPHEFRNLLLLEQPNGDFADTQVRQFLFDSWHLLLLRNLSHSSDAQIAAIADKSQKEVSYHLRRSSQWIVRLGDGTPYSRDRLIDALDWAWDYVGEMFEMDALEHAMLALGIGCDLAALYREWHNYIGEVLLTAGVAMPSRKPFQVGGKRGEHSEYLLPLLMEMQYLQRAYPGAQW